MKPGPKSDPNPKPNYRPSPLIIAAGILSSVVSISGLIALHSLWLPNVFVSAAAGIASFMLLMWIMLTAREHRFRHFRRDDNPHTRIIDALSEIARGNFNVFLSDEDTFSPFSEMTDAFNKMARNLGDLETMRQDFISNVSHEIQSPLTSIGGFAALLKNDALTAGERRHYAEIIEAETKRLSSLSDNLLKLSALDSEKKPLNPQNFRLDKQLQEIALMLEPQWAAKNISLELDAEKRVINADEDLLSQAWVNLLHNAIKFTNRNIKITLKDNTVTVEDDGAGIAESDLPRLFERFYKADKSRDRAAGGNGLGLSLVRKIIELHGGSVTVRSEIGKGTVFTVTLPDDIM